MTLDWDFVRHAGRTTDPGAVLQRRMCAKCGGPYRSEINTACGHCHTPRADAQAGWRLDRNYLVVQTSRRGHRRAVHGAMAISRGARSSVEPGTDDAPIAVLQA